MVFQLVDRIPNSEPDEDTIKFQVGKFKKAITDILRSNNKSIAAEPQKELVTDNSSAKLFEEIKVMFQDLPSRLEGNISPKYRGRKKRRFHPMMMKELMHMSKSNKAGILISLGFMRDEMPWLYDIGVETLRIIDSNNSKKDIQQAFSEFEEIVMLSAGNPMMEEFIESKEDYIMYEKFPRMILHEMESYLGRKLK